MTWVYVTLLVLMMFAAIAGQVWYQRALESSGIQVPRIVKILRGVNLTLLGAALVGVVVYILVKG